MLQRHDRDEQFHARRPACQRHVFVVTYLLEKGCDSHGLRGWRPIHHEARGVQDIGKPLVGDRGNGDKAIGVLCRSRHTPKTRGDGSADGIGHTELYKYTGESQHDVSQGR